MRVLFCPVPVKLEWMQKWMLYVLNQFSEFELNLKWILNPFFNQVTLVSTTNQTQTIAAVENNHHYLTCNSRMLDNTEKLTETAVTNESNKSLSLEGLLGL